MTHRRVRSKGLRALEVILLLVIVGLILSYAASRILAPADEPEAGSSHDSTAMTHAMDGSQNQVEDNLAFPPPAPAKPPAASLPPSEKGAETPAPSPPTPATAYPTVSWGKGGDSSSRKKVIVTPSDEGITYEPPE
jgi:hypothetical protein